MAGSIILAVALVIIAFGVVFFIPLKNKFKKKISLLNEQDCSQLREIERQSYLEAAKEIVKKRGTDMAKAELEPQKRQIFP